MSGSAADRTEKATPKKRQQAREEGQVARSMDLSGALLLVVGFAVLMLTLPRIGSASAEMLRESLAAISTPEVVTRDGLSRLLSSGGVAVALAVAPVAAACLVAGLVANVAQVGWKPSAKVLRPRPSRINPLQGAKNVFGPHGLVEGGKSLVKVTVVGAIVALVVFPRMEELAGMVGLPPELLASELAGQIQTIAIWGTAAYVVIGVIDVFYQRHRHEKQLKMSKYEVKQEGKEQDVPPEVKMALRRRQREAARARMMAAVPTADVVVTNPTHYAVALRYDGSAPAPLVIAKGRDLIAARIREIAEEHDVPLVSDPPLARSLHKAAEVGQQIPESLFQAVAQVLAFVYRQAAGSALPSRRGAV